MNARISQKVFFVVLFCFLLSGVAGLIYQVVWSRYLALFLGHTSYAVVAVLTAFMAGLAIGNAWLGKRADQTNRPLFFYGILEVAIGLYAIFFPFYHARCEAVFVSIASALEPGGAALLTLKFAMSFALILLPTLLMGATFPALTRFATRSLAELRSRVGLLYFINSAGAVLGCVIADFWWIPSFGLEVAMLGGAAMNIFAGLAAVLASKAIDEASTRFKEPPPAAGDEVFTSRELKIATAAIGVSGFVAMLYEVAWTRMLALVLGSSTHAFSLMLITFISGIAAGAAIVAALKRTKNSMNALAQVELALAGSVFVSMFFFDQLPYWFLKMAGMLSRGEQSYAVYQLVQLAICFFVMFIPATCLGMTLPLVSRIATARLADTGGSVGKVFAVNTAGTVLGAGITGLLLMPGLGLAQTFATGVALNAAIGFAVLWRDNPARLRACGWIAAFGLLPFMLLVGGQFEPQWQKRFAMGWFRDARPPATLKEYDDRSQVRLRYYKDGATATVAVQSAGSGTNENFFLRVNGKADASSTGDMRTQIMMSHIPLTLRPGSKNVLVVGLGSGVSAGAALRHPSVEKLTVVEISPEVADAARFFAKFNGEVFSNKKFHLKLEDAKSFLKTTKDTYDVIVSEPSNPWMAGVAGVFSSEYYMECRAHMAADGVFAQWLQVYETDDAAFHAVLRTFSGVFPNFSIWRTQLGDLVLLGRVSKSNATLEQFEKEYSIPAVKGELSQTGIDSFSAFLSSEIISEETAPHLPPLGGPVHSDLVPCLDYLAQKAFYARSFAQDWRTQDENLRRRPRTLLGRYIRERGLKEADVKSISLRYMTENSDSAKLLYTLALNWMKLNTNSFAPVQLLQFVTDLRPNGVTESLRLARDHKHLLTQPGPEPDALRAYELFLMTEYRHSRSAFNEPDSTRLKEVINRLLEIDPRHYRVYKLHLSEIAWDEGDEKMAFTLGGEAFVREAKAEIGPLAFSMDVSAPIIMLANLLENTIETGRIDEARNFAKIARERRFLTNKEDAATRRLAVLVQRIEYLTGTTPEVQTDSDSNGQR